MVQFCLQTLTLLDTVSAMPLCVHESECVCVLGRERAREWGNIESESQRGRTLENRFFVGALVVPASLPWLQTKPTYVSVSPPHPYTHSFIHTQTLNQCLCQQRLRESCTGEKRGNERRRRRGSREMKIENRFIKWSIPNRTMCLLWETPFIYHPTAEENRAFGQLLVCVFVCEIRGAGRKIFYSHHWLQ